MASAVAVSLVGLLGTFAAPDAGAATQAVAPLVDRAPAATGFADRVLTGPRTAVQRRSLGRATGGAGGAYRTADGYAVTVSAARGYALDDAVARTYVDFLGGLPHGAELGRLKVVLAPPATMDTTCGGSAGDGILACYEAANATMYVPGEEISASTGGVTTSYVIAHEYGHHVAANRSNAPFSAGDFGPKRWASRELVCLKTDQGLLFPGNEGARYAQNPGENWAEAYARLTYPAQPWTFSSLLTPDTADLAAARADVLTPWTRHTSRTFRGSFSSAGPSRRAATITLTLDGAFSVQLKGPSTAQYDLAIDTDDGTHEKTTTRGARDSLAYQAACRGRLREKVTVTVVRRSGSGPYTLSVKYAG